MTKQFNWLAVGIQFLFFVAFALIFLAVGLSPDMAALAGLGLYFVVAFALKRVVPKAHQQGMRLLRQKDYEQARQAFEESYRFFEQNLKYDQGRAWYMMSVSAVSYQEMALLNIGYCYMMQEDNEQAKNAYQQALEKFPDSWMAKDALLYFEEFEKQPAKEETSQNLLKDEDDVELV